MKRHLKAVARAVRSLEKNDRDLLELGVHERTAAARLGVYLDAEFKKWNVDCEYNRNLEKVKRLPKNGISKGIVPDIVIHRRNTDANLFAFELKTRPGANITNDVWKLQGLTSEDHDYRYRMGFHLTFDKQGKLKIADVYVGGGLNQEVTEKFRKLLKR